MLPFFAFSEGKFFTLKNGTELFQTIRVNGKSYSIDSIPLRIPTNYPKLDSICLLYCPGNNRENEYFILADFMPDSSYTIVPACCASIDIVKSRLWESDSLKSYFGDYEETFSKIQSILLNKVNFEVRILNAKKDEDVFAWIADHACFANYTLTSKNFRSLKVSKCFYWTNINVVEFVRFQKPINQSLNGYFLEEFRFPETKEILASISLRIFEQKTRFITYDCLTGKINLN